MTKKYNLNQDPWAERESQRYQKPIPSREYIQKFLKERGTPASRKQILKAFELIDPDAEQAMRRRLRAMEHEGQLIRNRRGAYGLVEKMDLIHGVVVGHRDGYGFLVSEEGGNDLYLSSLQMQKVLHGDRVLAGVINIDNRGRREAEIVEVLEFAIRQVVGRVQCEKGVYLVRPDNQRITRPIVLQPDGLQGAQSGQIVVVELLREGLPPGTILGRVHEILTKPEGPELEIAIALHSHQLPHLWPREVTEEAERFSPHFTKQELDGREDLRQLPLVTIDGEDAKDFDDAVYAHATEDGHYRLIVAIADVSHYVKFDAPLDVEAQNRGTSVYFPGRVIPMLPEILSNELCSLLPRADRLCLAADMKINSKGDLKSYQFYPAVIHSQARLTYNQVAAIVVQREVASRKQFADLVPHLETLYELYKVLRQKRDNRGAIDFDTTESIFVFNKNNHVDKIIPMVRNDAHKLIEECMITANIAAALFLSENKIPTLYRIHEPPPDDKLESVQNFLQEFRLKLNVDKGKPQPQAYAKVIRSLSQKPYAHLVQTVLLRSLSQAIYSPKNLGHFGLALTHYAHFTSPIRRYPDLLVHRAIHHKLHYGSLDDYPYDFNRMVLLGQHCSNTERRADEATWDVEARLKCEFMQDKLGAEYAGVITGVANFGMFIELSELLVEGLLHVTSLKNDYYHFDPVKHRLSGERTGICYRLGDQIRVRVVHVDVEGKKIDLELADLPSKAKRKDSKKK